MLRSLFAACVDLVLPARCAGCDEISLQRALCPACTAMLGAEARLSWPTPAPKRLPPPWAVASYDGPVRAALLAHKEHGRTALALPLGAALGRSLVCALRHARAFDMDGRGLARVPPPEAQDVPKLLAVPIPSAPAAVRARGDDPLRRLARHAVVSARAEGWPVRLFPVLRVARRVSDQAGLDAVTRSANLRGAHIVRPRLTPQVAGHVVVLLDDVVTTGATLAEAARALRAAGAEVVGAATVAATRRYAPRLSPAPGSD